MVVEMHCCYFYTRVLDLNSPSKIKIPTFNAGLKNMTKLVRIKTGWQWPSLGTTAFRKIQKPAFPTPAITLKIYGLELKAVVPNDGH